MDTYVILVFMFESSLSHFLHLSLSPHISLIFHLFLCLSIPSISTSLSSFISPSLPLFIHLPPFISLSPGSDVWSVCERSLFFKAMDIHSKDFTLIQNMVINIQHRTE